MKSLVLRSLPIFAATLLLAACGGGGSPVSTSLSGTAATGAPVVNGQVSVSCGTALPVTGTTAANGTWQVQVPNITFPCVATVTGGSLPAGMKLYGYATSATNVDVTPLTTLIGAYASKAVNGGTVTQAALDAAVTSVNNLLATAGLPALPANPLTATFNPVAGDQYDDYLESVMATLASQNIALTDLVAQISTTGAPAAPVKARTIDFSDNQASVSVVTDGTASVLQLQTLQSALASANSYETGIKGNRANFGTEVFQGMKLSQFPGISFKSKDDGTGYTGAGLPYLNYTISKQCDGAPSGWANLITNIVDMNPSAPDADGYVTYSADITSGSWKSSSYNNPILASDGTTTVLPPNSATTGASLQALIAAYPNACIYNWPNPDAQVPNATNTPAVMLMLGSSANVTAKKAWFKDIKVGDVVLF